MMDMHHGAGAPAAPPREAEDVLSFWFGDLDEEGLAAPAAQARWFSKDPAFDQEVRERFGALHASLLAGERADWQATPRGRLGAVIVLDQLSRNMFRDTPDMYGADPAALSMALAAIDGGEDRLRPADERIFLYLPLMHAEDLALQDRCVSLFAAWRDGASGRLRERLDHNLHYAILHRDIVARFGRFPHRNAILGRATTAEEQTFLQGPDSSF